MSYQVLARKWRPAQFTELVGQDHVVRALTHALEHNRLHHAYLFTGTRGIGKTTLARLLACCLNCERGVSAKPCGQCGACQGIAAGRFIDILEIDAASHTGVDNIRELLGQALYAPVRGRYKVYLIDEVHMLSRQAFSALLLTLEEPPDHIKFVLATTDPARLPATILSRCLQFHLRNLSVEVIVEYTGRILAEEKIEAESDAIRHIAKAADGSMRDALSLIDQAVSFGGGKLVTEQVVDMLGVVDQELVGDIFVALSRNDGARLLELADQYLRGTPDVDALFAAMATLAHRVATAKTTPAVLDAQALDTGMVRKLVDLLSVEATQLYYQAALNGRKDLPIAPDARTALQMTLLRMLAFSPLVNLADERIETAPPLSSSQAGPDTIGFGKADSAEQTPARTAAAEGTENPLPGAIQQHAPGAESATAVAPADAPTAAVEQAGRKTLAQAKPAVAARLAADGPEDASAIGQHAASAQATSEDMVLPATSAEAHAGRAHVSPDQQKAAEQAIQNDDLVQQLRTQFNATIKHGSIRPV